MLYLEKRILFKIIQITKVKQNVPLGMSKKKIKKYSLRHYRGEQLDPNYVKTTLLFYEEEVSTSPSVYLLFTFTQLSCSSNQE